MRGKQATSEAQRRKPVLRHGGPPIYLQVADILKTEIAPKCAAEGRSLPSEEELAREFQASRVTVRQALKVLAAKGLIYSEKGRGSFPSVPRVKGLSGFSSFTSEVIRAGKKPKSTVIDHRIVPDLDPDLSDRVRRKSVDGAPYFLLRRLRFVDGLPVAIEDAYLRADDYPGIEDVDFKNRSLYATLRDYWGIVPFWTDAVIEPAVADKEQSGLLKVPQSSPLLVAWRATLTENDREIEFVKSVYREGFALTLDRHRIG